MEPASSGQCRHTSNCWTSSSATSYQRPKFISYFYGGQFCDNDQPTDDDRQNADTSSSEVVKSDSDNRDYRFLILSNKLKVLVISDPDTEKAAAALSVEAGSMQDPWDLPGLAHFCEHMLFLGTEKYPEENSFQKYLTSHGGDYNAFTQRDLTDFYFDVSPEALDGALDRFAQFFIAPLFTQSATDREINAVNSEHEKNVPDDEERRRRVDASLTKSNHPYSKFDCGNQVTLRTRPQEQSINLEQELENFRKAHYSSNLMSLVVLSKEPCDLTQRKIEKHFNPIKNFDNQVPTWSQSPYGPNEVMTRIDLVPVMDIMNLCLIFPVPDYTKHYKTGTVNYVGFLLEQEGPGSLLAFLKKEHWTTNGIVILYERPGRGFAVVSVEIELTQWGFKNIDKIVGSLFQYIEMLKKRGPQRSIWEEIKTIGKTNFRFLEKEKPINYVQHLAALLPNYPSQDVIACKHLISDFNPRLITELLNLITPTNMRIIVSARSNAEIADKTEEWYGAKYKCSKIDPALIKKWKNCGLNKNFALPPPNKFLPTRFNLKERDPMSNGIVPRIIEQNELCQVWYLQDNEFNLPMASIMLAIKSPLNRQQAKFYNLSCLMTRVVQDCVSEFTADAANAGLSYDLESSIAGLTLTVNGYDENVGILFHHVLKALVHFNSAGNRYLDLVDEYKRELQNWQDEEPYVHAIDYTNGLLRNYTWSSKQLEDAMKENEYAASNLVQFAKKFFDKVKLEWFFHGNLTECETLELYKTSFEHFREINAKSATPIEIVGSREGILPTGSTNIFRKEHQTHWNSCALIFLQTGMGGLHETVVMDLIENILNEPAYDILRTKEQLGYLVISDVRKARGTLGLRILVQGEKEPEFLDRRIEKFLDTISEAFENLTEKEFLESRKAVCCVKAEKPKNLWRRGIQIFEEIIRETFLFDRQCLELKELESVTLTEVQQFFKDWISPKAPKRKKLVVHIASAVKNFDRIEEHERRTGPAIDIDSTSKENEEESATKIHNDEPSTSKEWEQIRSNTIELKRSASLRNIHNQQETSSSQQQQQQRPGLAAIFPSVMVETEKNSQKQFTTKKLSLVIMEDNKNRPSSLGPAIANEGSTDPGSRKNSTKKHPSKILIHKKKRVSTSSGSSGGSKTSTSSQRSSKLSKNILAYPKPATRDLSHISNYLDTLSKKKVKNNKIFRDNFSHHVIKEAKGPTTGQPSSPPSKENDAENEENLSPKSRSLHTPDLDETNITRDSSHISNYLDTLSKKKVKNNKIFRDNFSHRIVHNVTKESKEPADQPSLPSNKENDAENEENLSSKSSSLHSLDLDEINDDVIRDSSRISNYLDTLSKKKVKNNKIFRDNFSHRVVHNVTKESKEPANQPSSKENEENVSPKSSSRHSLDLDEINDDVIRDSSRINNYLDTLSKKKVKNNKIFRDNFSHHVVIKEAKGPTTGQPSSPPSKENDAENEENLSPKSRSLHTPDLDETNITRDSSRISNYLDTLSKKKVKNNKIFRDNFSHRVVHNVTKESKEPTDQPSLPANKENDAENEENLSSKSSSLHSLDLDEINDDVIRDSSRINNYLDTLSKKKVKNNKIYRDNFSHPLVQNVTKESKEPTTDQPSLPSSKENDAENLPQKSSSVHSLDLDEIKDDFESLFKLPRPPRTSRATNASGSDSGSEVPTTITTTANEQLTQNAKSIEDKLANFAQVTADSSLDTWDQDSEESRRNITRNLDSFILTDQYGPLSLSTSTLSSPLSESSTEKRVQGLRSQELEENSSVPKDPDIVAGTVTVDDTRKIGSKTSMTSSVTSNSSKKSRHKKKKELSAPTTHSQKKLHKKPSRTVWSSNFKMIGNSRTSFALLGSTGRPTSIPVPTVGSNGPRRYVKNSAAAATAGGSVRHHQNGHGPPQPSVKKIGTVPQKRWSHSTIMTEWVQQLINKALQISAKDSTIQAITRKNDEEDTILKEWVHNLVSNEARLSSVLSGSQEDRVNAVIFEAVKENLVHPKQPIIDMMTKNLTGHKSPSAKHKKEVPPPKKIVETSSKNKSRSSHHPHQTHHPHHQMTHKMKKTSPIKKYTNYSVTTSTQVSEHYLTNNGADHHTSKNEKDETVQLPMEKNNLAVFEDHLDHHEKENIKIITSSENDDDNGTHRKERLDETYREKIAKNLANNSQDQKIKQASITNPKLSFDPITSMPTINSNPKVTKLGGVSSSIMTIAVQDYFSDDDTQHFVFKQDAASQTVSAATMTSEWEEEEEKVETNNKKYDKDGSGRVNIITDIEEWKKTLEYYPLPPSFMMIPNHNHRNPTVAGQQENQKSDADSQFDVPPQSQHHCPYHCPLGQNEPEQNCGWDMPPPPLSQASASFNICPSLCHRYLYHCQNP